MEGLAKKESPALTVCVNYKEAGAKEAIAGAFRLLAGEYARAGGLTILCIGTDRATGDSLGPLVGHTLESALSNTGRDIRVYGTLEFPVHAGNLQEALGRIKAESENSFIVAVDASLGRMENIGRITIGKGHVRPGAGINKRLPPVGDAFITGVVNYWGTMEMFALQNTRLSLVMNMARVVSDSILCAVMGRAELTPQ